MDNPFFEDSEEAKWTLVAAGSATVAAIVVRKLMKAGWRRVRDEDPPVNPADPAVEWREALVWAGVSAAGVAVARLLARRGAAAGWRSVRGRMPPV